MWQKRWFRRLVWVVLAVFVATQALDLLLSTRRVRNYFTARLSATFGRPVEVSRFEFSLLRGPRIVANYITVAEDPRFGHEYFLRAERLSAGPRWRSLLRGRFDFGTLTLTRPSVNLVRAPDGQWNLERWLPPLESPAAPSGKERPVARAAVPPYSLKVDSGRINFKRGVDKHPFALVDLNGRVDQEAGGRWWIDLEARLARAGVILQEAGTLRVRGHVGGTSARLRPAELSVTWEEAALADALRLLRGWDLGIRGQLSLELAVTTGFAQTPPSAPETAGTPLATQSPLAPWQFSGTLRVLELHRWDLPHRPSDPAFNLQLEARWWPERARVEVQRALFEAARSSIRASGFFEWAPPGDSSLRFVSSGIHLDDLLAYYRAFRPGVAEGLALDGNAGIDLELAGWPPRIQRGVLATDGVRLRVPGLAEPLGVGRTVLRLGQGKMDLLPTSVTLRGPRSGLRLDATAALGEGWRFAFNLGGQAGHVEDLQALAAGLGWPAGRDWSVQGSANLRLRWQGQLYPFVAQPTGTVELRAVLLQAPFLAEPVTLAAARWELLGAEHRVTLTSALAFGARWSGTLARRAADAPWEFTLAADQLDIGVVNRWLGPRAQPGLLERVVPRRRDSTGALAALDAVRAQGHVSIARFLFAPLELRHLRARVGWRGRRLELSEAEADLYSGSIRGSFRAEFADPPAYDIEFTFSRVDLAQLCNATRPFSGRLAGKAAGELALATRGAERESLIGSLEGRGTLEVRDAQVRGFNLLDSFAAGRRQPGVSLFRSAAGNFAVSNRTIQIRGFRLSAAAAELDVQGRSDFSRALDLLVRVLPPAPGARPIAGRTFRISGPFDSPVITPIETGAPPRP
jgi:hypothetical protein